MLELLAKPGLFPAILIYMGTQKHRLKCISQAICCILHNLISYTMGLKTLCRVNKMQCVPLRHL